MAFFGLIWIGIFLAPTLLVPVLPAYEHRNYISLIGFLIVISTLPVFKDAKFGTPFLNIMYVILAVFFVRSYVHADTFKDRWNFWENATVDSPFAPFAHVNLGKLKEQMDELDVAFGHYKTALEMDSSALKANNNYGAMLYIKYKKNDLAAYYFKREVKFHPNNVDALNNLGIYYRNKGDLDSSLIYWKELVHLNKYYLNAYPEIIKIYQQKRELDSLVKYKEMNDYYNTYLENKMNDIK